MNLSDLSVEGLTQLEARLAADLEMVKRVKALVVEYQNMGVSSAGVPGGLVSATGLVAQAAAAPGVPSAPATPASPLKPNEERLTEALATMSAAGFILDNLRRATYCAPHGCVDKDTVKSWIKSMVRKGKVRVVETRTGRIGSLYAAVLPAATGAEG
ncbi:MAG: hypothetical protein K1X78_25395 [Verrucomicrobiaceae bacterium]|nr:hypothetical protein [Verrucomicrobiaceae bacterium]